jgi:hypothetical protein
MGLFTCYINSNSGGKMAIKTIEIICIPCAKCDMVETKIREAIKSIEQDNKIKIAYEFKRTINLRDISKYNISPSQAPAVIINGALEFAGRIETSIIKRRLEAIHRNY